MLRDLVAELEARALPAPSSPMETTCHQPLAAQKAGGGCMTSAGRLLAGQAARPGVKLIPAQDKDGEGGGALT